VKIQLIFGRIVEMRILWIVNMVLPDLANHLKIQTSASGTWMEDLSKKIAETEGIELAIAAVWGDRFQQIRLGNICYYLLPGNGKTMLFYNKKLTQYWDIIESEYHPDIIHLHGTEYSHGLSYIRKYSSKRVLLTIQGIISKIQPKNAGEMLFREQLKSRTIKEYLRLNGIIESTILQKINSKYEQEIIKRSKYATGRTDWDKFYMKAINPEITYFRCNYNLRNEFYTAPKWRLENIRRYTIYASNSAQIPLKGGHMLLKALTIVKRYYPDVKVTFVGTKLKDGRMDITNGYGKYISRIIKKYNLEDNVEFVGRQSTKGVIDYMIKAHIAAIPSAMENASATLREAMHLGVPCIAPYRGGMTELIKDGLNGFVYDYSEYEYLAGRIMELFSDEAKCCDLSKNAINSATVWHNRDKNPLDMVHVYQTIMEGN
jgi:glycosyltransferase involved in cell wall biosynthesis